MRAQTVWVVMVAVAVAGCGEGGLPLDELPLRDALRADPEVIATLPEATRLRLGARLEAARAVDDGADQLSLGAGDGTGDGEGLRHPAAAAVVSALDSARQQRQSEPLIVGQLASDGWARPLRQAVAEADRPVLSPPPVAMDGAAPAGGTATLEARALDGAAGAWLRSLAAASGARHLRRVVGWPIGAITVGDTIYVNAAWLVAVAPASGGGPDGGADATAPSVRGTTSATATATGAVPDAPSPAGPPTTADQVRSSALTYGDGGTEVMPAQDPAPSPEDDQACSNFAAGCADSCAASNTTDNGDACSDTSDDGGDSCDSTSDDGGDDCSSSTDDGTDACASSADDSSQACASAGDDAGSGCQIGAGANNRPPRRGRGLGSHRCLLLPLGYLLLIRRRR